MVETKGKVGRLCGETPSGRSQGSTFFGEVVSCMGENPSIQRAQIYYCSRGRFHLPSDLENLLDSLFS